MVKRFISLSILGCLCAPVFAQDQRSTPDTSSWYFSAGTHTEFYNNIQNDASGGTRKFDFAPTLGVGLLGNMFKGLHFIPEFNWVLPRSAGSSKIMKNLFMLRADLGWDAFDWLRLRAGTSLMWANFHGQGGSTTISNGNDTSTFYYPDENRSALNNTFDLGLEFLLADEWSTRLQTYTYSLFRAQARQVSYTLFISYHWK
jgi:hypothetical protein